MTSSSYFFCRFLACFFYFLGFAFSSEQEECPKGAGIFIINYFSGKPYGLLSKRADFHKQTEQGWVNPGGEQDEGETLAQTAARETSEELFHLFNFEPRKVASLPCVTLETVDPRRFSYTMFFAELQADFYPPISHERLQRAYDDARDGTQRELVDFAWLPMAGIIKNIFKDKEFRITSLDGRTLNLKLLQGLRLSLKKAFDDGTINFNGELALRKRAAILNRPLKNHPDVDVLARIEDLLRRLKDLRKQYPDHTPVVFFDLDNTLIAYENRKLSLIESATIHKVLKKLKKWLIPYFGLTARPYRHSAGMKEALDFLEVGFTKADRGIVNVLAKQGYSGVGYDYGIFYCNHMSKPLILSHLLGAWPSDKVLCIGVDDLRKNTDPMADFFNGCNENIVGQVYHYISPQVVSPYSPNFPIIAKKDQELVAKVSLLKKQTIKEIKGRFAPASIVPSLSLTQKSFTLSHAKLILGSDFVPGISPDIIQENIVRVLRVIDKFHEEEMLRDSCQRQLPTNLAANHALQKTLHQFITRELQYPNHVAVYQAAPRGIGFVCKVYTEMIQQLEGFPDLQEKLALRFFYDALQTPTHTIGNIDELLTVMKSRQQQNPEAKFNYLPGYNDIMMSVNWSPFGNYCHLGSSTLLFYLFNACGRSQSVTDLLVSTMTLFDVEEKYNLPEYVKINYIDKLLNTFIPHECGWILQIFIPKDQINRLTYLSQVFGYEHVLPHPDKAGESLTPLDLNELFQENPEQIEKLLQENISSFNVPSERVKRILEGEYHKSNLLQGRLLVLPEIRVSSDVHMFSTPLVDVPHQPNFDLQLRLQVAKEVSCWLASKERLNYCQLGMPAPQVLSQSYYDMVERGTTGVVRPYQESTIHKCATNRLLDALYATHQTMSPFLSQHYLRIIGEKNPYFTNKSGSLSSLFREAMQIVENHGLQREKSQYAVAAEVIYHYAFNYPQQNFIKIVSNPFFLRRNFPFVRHYIEVLISQGFNFNLHDVRRRNVLDILVDTFIYLKASDAPSQADYVALIRKIVQEGKLDAKEGALEGNLFKLINVRLSDHFNSLYSAVAEEVSMIEGLDMRILSSLYQAVNANLKSSAFRSREDLQTVLAMIEFYLSQGKVSPQTLPSIKAMHKLCATYMEDYLDLHVVKMTGPERERILDLIKKIAHTLIKE